MDDTQAQEQRPEIGRTWSLLFGTDQAEDARNIYNGIKKPDWYYCLEAHPNRPHPIDACEDVKAYLEFRDSNLPDQTAYPSFPCYEERLRELKH